MEKNKTSIIGAATLYAAFQQERAENTTQVAPTWDELCADPGLATEVRAWIVLSQTIGQAFSNAVVDTTLGVLQDAFAADPGATQALMTNRIPCNKTLANHETIVAGVSRGDGTSEDSTYEVGAIGLINGIVLALTGRRVAIQTNKPNALGNDVLVGFQEWKDPSQPVAA